jgi:hypothetical protein
VWQGGGVLFLSLKTSQNSIDDVLVLDATVRRLDDDSDRSAAARADLDVYIEHALESLSPSHSGMALSGGADFCVGDRLDAFPTPGWCDQPTPAPVYTYRRKGFWRQLLGLSPGPWLGLPDNGQLFPPQTVSYLGVLQQALRDVSAWVEEGEAPPATTRYRIVEGQVHLPANAAETGGIQPVIELLANGAARAEVAVGEAVKLNATITVPPGTGKIVEAAWDLLGDGSFSRPVALKGEGREQVAVETSHRFDAPGTYFVTLRAASQREGDTATPFARIQNLERVRVVVN